MKFFFGILLVAIVALACAEEAKKELNRENAEPVSEAESEANARNKRGLLYGAYATPVVAAPIAAAPIAAAPVAYASPIAAPVAYSYSASVRYPTYAGYSPYSPYVPAVYL